MEAPDALSVFTIDDIFMNQWFDSFDPSIKTFAADFVINKMKRYDFNPELMEDSGDKYFATLLANHFAAFLKLKMMDENPGRLITGWGAFYPS